MREIKFRAWNSIDKCMCDNSTTLTNLRGFIKSRHYHPMQYTGLKDKNGVEIYEGDVLKCGDGYLWEVKWSEVNCGFLAEGEDVSTLSFDSEVIGNIHQNPELLD